MAMLNNQRVTCGNFESLKSLVNDLGDFLMKNLVLVDISMSKLVNAADTWNR